MSEEKIDLKKTLREYKFEFDLLQEIPCTQKENAEYLRLLQNGGTLPEGVYSYYDDDEKPTTEFYTIYEPKLSETELKEYFTLKKLKLLKTIKNCVLFFTILTIIFLSLYVIMLLAAGSLTF